MTLSRVGPFRWTAVMVAVSVALPVGQEPARLDRLDASALLVAGLYEHAEVAARADVDRLRSLHSEDSVQVANALDLLVRALVLNGRAASDNTLALALRVRRIKETRLGIEDAGLVPSLLNLGDVLVAAVRYEQAIDIVQRAVVLCERNTEPDGLHLAEALDHLGTALAVAGRYDEAVKALERSLRLKETALPATDVAVARTLEDLGLALQRKGDYARAGVPLRRAAAIQEAASNSHPAYARTLDLVAQQLWFEGRLVESREASERSVEVAEHTLRPDHPILALSLRHLAGTLGDLGNLSRSLALKQRALAIAEQNFGLNHAMTGVYLHSLGLAELDMGDYATARRHFKQALSSYEAGYGVTHEYVATALSVLAEADARLGDFASARREQARAVTVYERAGGPNHPFVASALTELASVYREQGTPTEALPALERALAIREKNFGPHHRDVARTLADLASTLMQIGRSTRAQQLASRALGIWDRLNTPDAPEYATALALYAEIQGHRGDQLAARDHYERALQIRGRVFGTSHPAYADAQSGLSLALANLRESDAALSTAAKAEVTGREHLRLMLRSLPERQALNYAAARPRGLNLILSLSGSMPDAVPVAVDGLIRSRALVLDEIAARHAARAPSERTDSARIALRSAQQRLANLTARGPGQMSPTQYTSVVEDARRDSELAEEAMAEQSVEFRAARSRAQLGLNEVLASLPADGALVSLVRYDRTLFAGPARSISSTVPSYLAFVLRANLPPAVVPLGSARAIDTLVTQWRADISAEALASAPVSGDGPARSSRQSGAALRRLIWDPVVSHLGNASNVFIVTDGLLNLVPFVALPIGQRSYLLEGRIVLHYLSAERDLVPASPATTPARGLLAIGGASFDDSSLFRGQPAKPAGGRSTTQLATLRDAAQGCGNFQTAMFQPLLGTLQEVKELSSVWNAGANSKDLADARVLVGRAASESAFKQEAGHYRVLHLATHGFFLGACSPVTSTTRGVGGLAVAGSPKAVDNPLLLSGLAFAGANRRASAGVDEDDGILTAEEVAALELEGVEWAVLSACDTGLGEVKAGEGVLGLRRAFQVAGARTVIMSLWPVDDQAARAWMGALYRGRFQNGFSTMEAVRSASLSVLRNRRGRGQSTYPFYWAGFVAAGDWR